MKYLLPVICLFILMACQEDRKEHIAKLVAEWKGKEIRFPTNAVFTRYVNDTVDYRIPSSDHKVIIYVDSVGCTSCKLQLDKWKTFMATVDSITGGSVPFLFFFQSDDYKEIQYILKRERFEHPVCIDPQNELNRLNGFPRESSFHTFLLDRNNEVILIGNPVHNMAVKDLYLKELGDRPEKGPAILTSAVVETPVIDLGNMRIDESRQAIFYLKNMGSQPLVILDASTTCGCAKVSYETQSADPDETLAVTVDLNPAEARDYDETIMIKCNTDQPVRLQIKAQVTGKGV